MSERVPEGWSASKLREICSSIRGVSYKPENLQSSKSEKTATLLRSNNIQAYGLNLNEVQYVDIDKVKPRQIALEGDIAVCMANGSRRLVGKNAIFRGLYSSETFTVGAFCSIIRANKNSTHQFIRHLLKSNAFTQQVGLSLAGSAINNLKDGDVEDYTFSLPPLPEQKKIASILTSVDEVIEKTQSQIDKLQNLKKATMNELLTRGIGHTEFKDSELGRIPKSWDMKKLGDLAEIFFSNVDKKNAEDEIPVFLCNYMDVYSNRNITKTIKFMEATATQREIDKFYISKGDVMITKDSETPSDIAVPSYVSEELENVLCGYHLALIRSDRNNLSGEFLSYLFGLDGIQHRYYQLANGSTRFGLTAEVITASPLPIPPLAEQKKIASTLTSIDKVIEQTQSKLEQTRALKKSLMQDLLTGKVRVSVN